MNYNNPVAKLHEWFQKNAPLVETKDSFAFTPKTVRDNKVLWAAKFIDPRSGEIIPSGSVQESKVSTFEGVNYYQTKKKAQQAAALAFFLRQRVENDSDQNNTVARGLNAIGETRLVPKKEIHEYFNKASIGLDSCINIIKSHPTDHNNPLCSCVFTHPSTEEDFPAGLLPELGATTINGVHHYSK